MRLASWVCAQMTFEQSFIDEGGKHALDSCRLSSEKIERSGLVASEIHPLAQEFVKFCGFQAGASPAADAGQVILQQKRLAIVAANDNVGG